MRRNARRRCRRPRPRPSRRRRRRRPLCAVRRSRPPWRHRVERVGDQLEQRLLQLHRDPLAPRAGRAADPTSSSTPRSRIGSAKAREQVLDQPVEPLRHRAEGRRPAEAQQVADPAVEPVHLLDDGVEMLGRATASRGGGGPAGRRRGGSRADSGARAPPRPPSRRSRPASPTGPAAPGCAPAWPRSAADSRSSGRRRGPARRSRRGRSAATGWSSRPVPTTAIAPVSSRIGRARLAGDEPGGEQPEGQR